MKYGIITQYYKSTNYGGNLQAYALCMALKKLGIESEQICYPTRRKKNIIDFIKTYARESGLLIGALKGFREAIQINQIKIQSTINHKQQHELHETEEKKKQAFSYFNTVVIPHSEDVYNDSDLYLLADRYDGLIVGSDQIWNPDLYRPGYFLEGIPMKGRRIAYAASISKDELTDLEREDFAKRLNAFNMISVREKKAIEILQPITDKEICYTADPTLLLSAEDWEKVTDKRLIDVPYAFCYFLGRNMESRKLASEYARSHGLKLAGIPMTISNNTLLDINAYDIPMNFASPGEFLSGIMNAEVVFTDSFHACVFAHIFSKPYIVFQRENDGRMSSRIDSLMDLFDSNELFIRSNNPDSLAQVETILRKHDFGKKTETEAELVRKSFEFLAQACEIKSSIM